MIPELLLREDDLHTLNENVSLIIENTVIIYFLALFFVNVSISEIKLKYYDTKFCTFTYLFKFHNGKTPITSANNTTVAHEIDLAEEISRFSDHFFIV